MRGGNKVPDGSHLQELLSSPSATPEEAAEKQRILDGLKVLVKKKPDFTDFMYGFTNGVEEAKDEVENINLQGGSYNPKKFAKSIRKSFELVGGAGEIFLENVPSNWSPGRVVGNRQYFTTPDNKTILIRPKPLPPPTHPTGLDGFVQAMDLVLSLVPGFNVLWSIGKMVDKAVRGEPVTLMDGLDLVMSVIGSIPLIGTAAKGLTGLSSGIKVISTGSKVTTTARLIAGVSKIASATGAVFSKAQKAVQTVLNGKRVKGVINLYDKWYKLQPHAQASAKIIKFFKVNTTTVKGQLIAGTIENSSKRIQTEIAKRTNNSATLDFPELPKITEPVELTADEKEMLDAFDAYKDKEELGYVNNEFFNARIAYYFFLLLQSVIDDDTINIDLLMAEAYEFAKLEAETGTEAFGLTKDDKINPNQLASALVQVKRIQPKSIYTQAKPFNKEEYYKILKPYITYYENSGSYMFNEGQQEPLANFVRDNKSINKLIDESMVEYDNYGYFKSRKEFIDAIQDDLVNAIRSRNTTVYSSGGITALNGYDTTDKSGYPLFNVPLPDFHYIINQAETGMSKDAFADQSEQSAIYRVTQQAEEEFSKLFKEKAGLKLIFESGKSYLNITEIDFKGSFEPVQTIDATRTDVKLPIDLQSYSHKQLVLLQNFMPTIIRKGQVVQRAYKISGAEGPVFSSMGEREEMLIENFVQRVKNYAHVESQDVIRERYLYEGFVTQLTNWLGPYKTDATERKPLDEERDLKDLFNRMRGPMNFFSQQEADHAVKEYFKYFYYGGLPIERMATQWLPENPLTNYRDMLVYSVDYAWVESTTTIPVVFFNEWGLYNRAAFDTLVFKIQDVKLYLEQEAKTQQEKDDEEEFNKDVDVIIEDLKDREDDVPVDVPVEIPPIDPAKEKKELEKEKVKTSKQDEMRLGLDLLKRFQKPKIQRQRIRLYNPNL